MTAALNPILNPPEFRPGAGLTDEMLAEKLGGLLAHDITSTMVTKDLLDDLKYVPQRLRWLSERLSCFEDAFNFQKSNALEVQTGLKQLKERLFILDLLDKNGFAITHTIGRADPGPRYTTAAGAEPEILRLDVTTPVTSVDQPPRRFINPAWMVWVKASIDRTEKEYQQLALDKVLEVAFPEGIPEDTEAKIVNFDTLEVVINQRQVCYKLL